MKTFFQNHAEKLNGNFIYREGTWFNGHAYMPEFFYKLKYTCCNTRITINYNFKQNEFSKPSAFDGGAYGDRHICKIECLVKCEKKHNKIIVQSRSFTNKIFDKNPSHFFKVNSKDKLMSLFLRENLVLNEIFKIAESSPEFSPLIIGEQKNEGQYVLTVEYNTQKEKKKVLEKFIQFVGDFSNLFNN